MRDVAGHNGVLLRLFQRPEDVIRTLADALFDIQIMGNPNSRLEVTKHVANFSRKFDPISTGRSHEDIVNILYACAGDDDSFEQLIAEIETYSATDDPDLERFKQLAQKLLPRSALTKAEFKELSGLGCDECVSPDSLAGWIGRHISEYGGEAGHDEFQPGNVREAALWLLDHPDQQEGLRRLVALVEWLSRVARYEAEDEEMAGALDNWAIRVRAVHGLPSETGTGAQADGADDQSAVRPVGSPASGPHTVTEHGASGQENPRYLVPGDEESIPALNPHERSLRNLGIALGDIKPEIFRVARVKGVLLRSAKRALRSVNPLIAAIGEAARIEGQGPRRAELQDLAQSLRDGRDQVSQALAELSAARTDRSARRPCNDLAAAAARFLADGQQAVRHAT
jgi:hypothetical protein